MAYAELSGTSQAKPSALPDTWVERLFQRMEDRYGDLWANRYGAFPRDRVKRSWAEDLGDLSRDELARGVDACRGAKLPPTLPEFRALCRPPIDFEAAFVEAVQQMAERDKGNDRWSLPAIFWAAVTIGAFDLRNSSWQTIEKRWRKVLQAELDKGEWQPVPARAIALPEPKPTARDREAAERVLSSVKIKDTGAGSKEWAERLKVRHDAGEALSVLQIKSYREALGIKPEERQKEAANA